MLLVDLGLALRRFGIALGLLARELVLLNFVFGGLLALDFGDPRRLNAGFALLATRALERLLFGRRQRTGHGGLRRAHGGRGLGRRFHHLLGRRRRQRGQRPGGIGRRGGRRGLLLRRGGRHGRLGLQGSPRLRE